ncbi:MAG: phage tail assembly chaperone [Limnohabitans sp.]
MSFVLKQSTTYTWPVTVEYPVDGGRTEKSTFDGEFKRLPQSRIKEITAAVEANELTDVDIAEEVLVGWSGVSDGADEIPFSQSALAQLLEVPLVASAIVMAFFNSLTGAKRKN